MHAKMVSGELQNIQPSGLEILLLSLPFLWGDKWVRQMRLAIITGENQ